MSGIEAAHVLIDHPKAAKWLKEQERVIVPPWIRAVQGADLPMRSRPGSRQMESAQLIELFDSVIAATETGDTPKLDAAIQALVTDRLGKGYSLGDFLFVANQLKSAIWKAAQESLSSRETIEVLAALEPLFAHSVARLAWLASRAAENQLEEELERTRFMLAKLDRVKSDFINIAAHELKTPLTLVQGYTAILGSELAGQRHLRTILRGLASGIKRLQTLIQDMLDVSLIDSNVLTLSLQPASLYEIIRLAVDDLEQEAVDRQLIIQISQFPREVNSVYIDSQRMYQVFTNLIGNAIKYTPDGGTIGVHARVLNIVEGDSQFVEVIVTDTGIGIEAEDLPHIFNKFYRIGETELHSTSKTQFKGGGPGLGLAIVKGIVEAHGGRIWAESPGCDEVQCPGSNFHVVLPIHVELPESPSQRLLGLEGETMKESP